MSDAAPPPRSRWLRRVGIALLALATLGGLGALGLWWWLRVPALDGYDTPRAMAELERVLHRESEDHDHAIAALAGAIERDPDDARAQLWFGLANLYGFLRERELPYAIRAQRALDRAAELDPSDTSAAGWAAFFRYQAARSRGDDLAGPRQALLDASAADPRFTPFLAAVSLAPMPLDSGYPQRVLAPLEAIEDCGDGTSSSCRTGHLFPHGTEGYHATLGDLRVRLGDVEGGREQYRRALEARTADEWPHRAAFEEWAADAEARAARLTNDDPRDDGPIFFATGERACSTCHETAR